MLDSFVKLLKSGEVVAFPTETVYGLGADAWNTEAVKKVFQTKGRPADNPLIVHISNMAMVEEFAEEIPEQAQKLMKAFWPGALTLIFKKKPEVPDIITGGLPTVALRWPDHPLSQELIEQSGPLVAPSANSSGKPSPTKPEHVKEDFGDDFPVIEAGETQIGLESTVLDVSESPFTIYRPGAVGKDQIEEVIGETVVIASGSDQQTAKSPGTKYTHYAPEASVRWLRDSEKPSLENVLYLFHSQDIKVDDKHIINYNSNYMMMAKELYDRFRQADYQEMDEVIVEPFSDRIKQQNAIVGALENRINKAIGN